MSRVSIMLMTVVTVLLVGFNFGCLSDSYSENRSVDINYPPILSPKINTDERDGDAHEYVRTPSFSLINQDDQIVDQKLVEDKVFVVEFFFTSCPSICPKVAKEMLKVYEAMKDRDDFLILSHSIDPRHDSPKVLKDYATDLGVSDDIWQFLTGKKEDIYALANYGYLTTVYEDEEQEGVDALMHSGVLVLVDKDRLIRGQYDGKDANSMKRLIRDAKILLR